MYFTHAPSAQVRLKATKAKCTKGSQRVVGLRQDVQYVQERPRSSHTKSPARSKNVCVIVPSWHILQPVDFWAHAAQRRWFMLVALSLFSTSGFTMYVRPKGFIVENAIT